MLPTRPSSPIDFEQIYRDYHKNVYNYIYGQLLHREAAEDLTADVFVAVATHLGQFDPARGSLTAWIFTIARNLTQNYRLRASTRMEESRENLPDMPAVPSKTVDDSLRSPENIRARVTGATAAAVSQKYHRLLTKCRKIDKDVTDDAP